MKKAAIILLAIILLANPVIAAKGSMKLLAVAESANGYKGSIANLELEIKEGSGKVFLDTSPLTKLDTQISTRLAKEIACRQLETDCSNHDFFYTMKADAAIVGGPSAGAATTILTMSLLDSIELKNDVAITGTINSGGMIGPVGGLKEKVEAAEKAGIKTALIPAGERMITWNNMTFDLTEYAKGHGITVIEVSDVYEALEQMTGKQFKTEIRNITVDEEYSKVMLSIAEPVCNRTKAMQKDAGKTRIAVDKNIVEAERAAINFSIKGETAIKDGYYYSAASYCFGANVNYRYILLRAENMSNKAMKEAISKTRTEIQNFALPEYKTLTDLQAYALVKERLEDAGDFLNKSSAEIYDNQFEPATRDLAFGIERLNSAYSWFSFFGKKGKTFDFKNLKNACLNKVSEAEERYQYVNLFLPGYLQDTRRKIDSAHNSYDTREYEECMVKASAAKGEADVILAIFGVENKSNTDNLVATKLSLTRRSLAKEMERGIFPVIGYSYYEYAESLKNEDPYSALLYSGYALEMSSWDLYFENGNKPKLSTETLYNIKLILTGLAVGLAAGFVIFRNKHERKKMILVRKKR